MKKEGHILMIYLIARNVKRINMFVTHLFLKPTSFLPFLFRVKKNILHTKCEI